MTKEQSIEKAANKAKTWVQLHSPFLSDWSNFESWEEAGAVETPQRANKIFKEVLAQYEAPPMDVAIREELEDFVERRKREGGAHTDF